MKTDPIHLTPEQRERLWKAIEKLCCRRILFDGEKYCQQFSSKSKSCCADTCPILKEGGCE